MLLLSLVVAILVAVLVVLAMLHRGLELLSHVNAVLEALDKEWRE